MQRSCSLSRPYLQFKMCSVLCVVFQFPLEIFAGNFDQTDKKEGTNNKQTKTVGTS